jgi:hypothetical protein
MGFRMLLDGTPGMTVIGEASNGAQAVRMVDQSRLDAGPALGARTPGSPGIDRRTGRRNRPTVDAG